MWLALHSVTRCAAAWQRDRRHCAAEAERAAAIAAPGRRAQFLAGRWLAASMLAEHCGAAVDDWQISCTPGQAPRVLGSPAGAGPSLSIAHRDDKVACAVADRPVGVDIEIAGRLRSPADDYAEWVLAPEERAEFAGLAPASREAYLLGRWALKEAWAKQAGCGLALGEMCSLAAQPMSAGGGNAQLWQGAGLVLALCAEGAPSLRPQAGASDGLDTVAAQAWQVDAINPRR